MENEALPPTRKNVVRGLCVKPMFKWQRASQISCDFLGVNRRELQGDFGFWRASEFQKETRTPQRGQPSHLFLQWGVWRTGAEKCNAARKFFLGTGQHCLHIQKCKIIPLFKIASWNVSPTHCPLILLKNIPLSRTHDSWLAQNFSLIFHIPFSKQNSCYLSVSIPALTQFSFTSSGFISFTPARKVGWFRIKRKNIARGMVLPSAHC